MNMPIRIKTFRSKTLQDAIEQIRREFGEDASILETKKRKTGLFGREQIEVTASNAARQNRSPSELDSGPSSGLISVEIKSKANLHVSKQADAPKLADDLTNITHTEEVQALDSPTANAQVPDENSRLKSPSSMRIERVCSQVQNELCEAGLDREMVSQWIEAARSTNNETVMQSAWTLRSEIQSWIRGFVHAARPLDIDSARQQIIAFVGPTGSGKSTTLAKLAASLTMEHGLSVGVLVADPLTMEANSTLIRYSEMLGWRYASGSTNLEIHSAREQLSDCRFVLVDTVGCSPTGKEALEGIAAILLEIKPTSTQLVIASTCNDRSFLRYEQAFHCLNPDSLILTKLDESGGLGPLFSCMQSCSLPISYLTDGKHVPTDLIPATSTRIAQQVLALN